ncbi:hypothetical protein ACIPRD_17305 [Streptomyces sp. NPDC090108]|uniref:hypothetical protein n=1 Tax=Streptomyces sp. NPDC090108 TaxID=3365947 RepID=UPI003805A188
MGQLLERRGVRTALAAMRADLVAAGLLRAALPGRTRAGRRTLKDARTRHPLPSGPDGRPPVGGAGLSDEEKLILAALYGDRALRLTAPRFARAAGLKGRGGTTERDLRQGWGGGGGSGSGGFGCGTV